MTEEEKTDAADLMNVLITKMERMDKDIMLIKQENEILHQMVRNPESLLKRAGFVRASTPRVEDVWGDPLRGGRDDVISKAGDGKESGETFEMPTNNQDWHEMTWDEIHHLADQAAESEGRQQ